MSGSKSTSPPDSPRSGQEDGGAEDRISDLPDSILGNILSFLPTNNSVATGILSKRWKSLWTLAPDLDFSCPENYSGSVELFVQYVNYVLLFHKHGCFQKLSLTWKTGCIPFYVNTWIGVALDRDVCGLFVSADVSKLPNQLQSSLFSSESLKSLELNCNICIPSSEIEFNLPRLERLKLISVYFDNDEAIDDILEGCLVLKYLTIHMDVGKMVEHGYLIANGHVAMNADGTGFRCSISSDSLTHLEISVNAFNSSPTHLDLLCCVDLDAPSLRCVKLDGFFLSIWVQQKSLACLEEANIEVNGPLFKEPPFCNSLAKAFSAFRCAESLALHDEVIRALSHAPVKMRTKFNRLTRLEVSTYYSYYWSSLLDFLMLSDSLVALYVHKYVPLGVNDEPYINDSNSDEKKLDSVPVCLSKSLRVVVIGGYCGHSDEIEMTSYITKHARLLKILHFGFHKSVHNDFKRKFELVQEICAFPRKSTVCEVNFHDCC